MADDSKMRGQFATTHQQAFDARLLAGSASRAAAIVPSAQPTGALQIAPPMPAVAGSHSQAASPQGRTIATSEPYRVGEGWSRYQPVIRLDLPEPLTSRKSGAKPCCDDCGDAEALAGVEAVSPGLRGPKAALPLGPDAEMSPSIPTSAVPAFLPTDCPVEWTPLIYAALENARRQVAAEALIEQEWECRYIPANSMTPSLGLRGPITAWAASYNPLIPIIPFAFGPMMVDGNQTIRQRVWNQIGGKLLDAMMHGPDEPSRWGALGALDIICNYPDGSESLINSLFSESGDLPIQITCSNVGSRSTMTTLPVPGRAPFRRCVDDLSSPGLALRPRQWLPYSIWDARLFRLTPRAHFPLDFDLLCHGPCPPPPPVDRQHVEQVDQALARARAGLRRAILRLNAMRTWRPPGGVMGQEAVDYLMCQFPQNPVGYPRFMADAVVAQRIQRTLEQAYTWLMGATAGPGTGNRIEFVGPDSPYRTDRRNRFYSVFAGTRGSNTSPYGQTLIDEGDPAAGTVTLLDSSQWWVAVNSNWLADLDESQRAVVLVHEAVHVSSGWMLGAGGPADFQPIIGDYPPDIVTCLNYERVVCGLAEMRGVPLPSGGTGAPRECRV